MFALHAEFACTIRDAWRLAFKRESLPNGAPIHLTVTLALELLTSASHSSPALWANPVQNAGEHVLRRSETVQSDKRHVSPPYTR
jgi:hypothetical protein